MKEIQCPQAGFTKTRICLKKCISKIWIREKTGKENLHSVQAFIWHWLLLHLNFAVSSLLATQLNVNPDVLFSDCNDKERQKSGRVSFPSALESTGLSDIWLIAEIFSWLSKLLKTVHVHVICVRQRWPLFVSSVIRLNYHADCDLSDLVCTDLFLIYR